MKNKTKRLVISLPEEDLQELKGISANAGIDLNTLVRTALGLVTLGYQALDEGEELAIIKKFKTGNCEVTKRLELPFHTSDDGDNN